jgi:hypothetical protein
MISPTRQVQQITMRFSGSREEMEGLQTMMRQWSSMVPTLFFLDICSISHIKTYEQIKGFKDVHHEKSITALQELDLPHNGVSYLPALMEKASDQRSIFSTEGFIDEANRDWNAMRTFFKSARVVEPMEFIEAYATDLFGTHPEQKLPEYLEFLQFANEMGLHNSVATAKRLKTAAVLCAKADELGIFKGHPIVLATIACVYGCLPAKLVMKFTPKPENFKPGNALGDILLIQRVGGKLTHAIQEAGIQRGPFVRSIFITADSPLQQLFSYFFVKSVSTVNTEEGSTDEFSIDVKGQKLFVDLFGSDGLPKDPKSAEDLERLYDLLGLQSPSAS